MMTPHEFSEILLREYARHRSETAFRELVKRRSGVVYGTALRMLGGDRHAAEEVMREVFSLLVTKAGSLKRAALTPWLYRQAYRQSANRLRQASRMAQKPAAVLALGASTDWLTPDGDEASELQSEIDPTLQEMASGDRNALVLHFLDGHDYDSVGEALGLSEEAARRRVDRALEKLAGELRPRGASVTRLRAGMSGMSSSIPSDEVIARVATRALESLPAEGGWGALLPLLKSFFTGLLVAGLGLAVWKAGDRGERSVASSSAPASGAGQIANHPDPSHAAGLVAVVKNLYAAGEGDSAGRQLEAELAKLPTEHIPEFFVLASSRLAAGEKDFCCQTSPVLLCWFSGICVYWRDFAGAREKHSQTCYPKQTVCGFKTYGAEAAPCLIDRW